MLTFALLSVALAQDARVVAVLQEDPVLRLVVAPGGAVPEPGALGVGIDGGYAEVQSTQSLVESGIPVATIVLVDTSGSMAPSFSQVQGALRALVGGMKGGDLLVIAPFDDAVTGGADPWTGVSGQAALSAKIDGLVADGRTTHLYEALNVAVDRLVADSAEYPLRSVLVLSDGEDEGSPEGQSLERARANAMKYGVRVDSVGFVPGKDDATSILRDLATDTGATYSLAADATAIGARFQELQARVHGLLVVGVRAEPMSAGTHTLRLTLPDATATAPLVLDRPFTGVALTGNDPEDHTLLYAAAGVGGVLAAIAGGVVFAFLVFRRESRLRAEIDVVSAEARRLAAESRFAAEEARQAAIDAPTTCRLLRSEGSILLFGPGVFGTQTVGSEAGPGVLFVEHPTISRRHATIERRRDDPHALYVTDLGSSNGSYHQGLDLRGRGTVRVGSRERLQFGLFATLVDVSDPSIPNVSPN